MVPNVRVVLLNFNGGQDIVDAVRSVTELDWPADRFHIVVVDNASSDGSPDVVATTFPDVQLIRSPVNVGFSANNLALADLDDVDFVALVNPDAIVDPGWLRVLVDAFEGHPRTGAACPRMLLHDRFVDVSVHTDGDVILTGVTMGGVDHLDACERAWRLLPSDQGPNAGPDDSWVLRNGTLTVPIPRDGARGMLAISLKSETSTEVTVSDRRLMVGPDGAEVAVSAGRPYDVANNTGVRLLAGGYGADRHLGVRADELPTEPDEVFGWTGGGVLLRAEYLRDVGLFDDLFFLYYEDVDMSWRGRARGWTYRHVPDAVMWHRHAASTGDQSGFFVFHNERSRLLFVFRHFPVTTALGAMIGFVMSTGGYLRADAVRPLLQRRRPSGTVVSARLRALVSVVASGARLIRARRNLSRQRSEQVASIMSWMERTPS